MRGRPYAYGNLAAMAPAAGPGAPITVTHIGNGITGAGGANCAVTSLITCPVGGHIFLLMEVNSGVNYASTEATDSRGNTYDAQYNSGGSPRSHWVVAPVTTQLEIGDTITAAYASTNGEKLVVALYITGLAASFYDVVGTQTTASSTDPTVTLSGMAGVANQLLLGYVTIAGAGSTVISAFDADYTFLPVASGTNKVYVGYRYVTTPSSDTFANTLSATNTWCTNLWAVKGA